MHRKTILRAADVCSILSISLPTLYRWQRIGNFPKSIKLGPNLSGWEQASIDAWLAQKKTTQLTAQ